MAQLSKQRVTGTVKWFNGQKGFGFISPDDGGEDLFVHQTSIKTEGFRVLNEGDSVEFVVERGGDGRTKAVDVVTNSEGSAMSGVGGGRGGGRGFSVGRGRGFGRGGGRRGGRMSGGGGACYNCGKSGHLARDCTQQGVGGGGVRYGSGGGGGGGGCYNCGGYGHLARECPNN